MVQLVKFPAPPPLFALHREKAVSNVDITEDQKHAICNRLLQEQSRFGDKIKQQQKQQEKMLRRRLDKSIERRKSQENLIFYDRGQSEFHRTKTKERDRQLQQIQQKISKQITRSMSLKDRRTSVIQEDQTVMSEKLLSVTDELGIKDSVRSAMLNRLLGSGSHQSFDMRCMVTGQFGVGKLCLVKLLAGEVIPEGRHTTDGISLVEGRCGLDIETRSWIMIDPETYSALDVVYNKVLMTSEEENESQLAEKPDKPVLDMSPIDSKDKDNSRDDRPRSHKLPSQHLTL